MGSQSNIVFLGAAQVDTLRGEIIIDGSKSVIEPKVMAVLVYLMAQQGEVVPSEKIHEQVWQDAIVSPSTLQRAIAILRKALGDSSKAPKYIKTYPRRGYSLEVPVIVKPHTKQFPHKKYFNLFLVSLILCVSTFLYFKFHPLKTNFEHRNIITSSSSPEFQSIFSPSENMITYIKKNSDNKSVLVESDLGKKTQRIVSKEYDEIMSFDYANTGNSIIALVKTDTSQLVNINLENGTETVLDISKIGAADDIKQIKVGTNNQVYILSINNSFEHNIYRFEQDIEALKLIWSTKSMYGFGQIALSENKQYLAIHFVDKKQKAKIQFIDLINYEFKPLLSHKAVYAHIAWHPNNTHLLISDLLSAKVQFLNLNGEVFPAKIASHKKQHYPNFNRKGQLLITQTSLDTDLYVFDTQTNDKKLVSDSIHQDLMAIPSLTNNKQVIVSRRLGKTQIFLKHNEQLSLVYANEANAEYISPPIWSPNEENIAFSADGKLVFINLKKSEIKLSTLDYDINRVLDWHENGNKVLLKGFSQGQDYLLEWSINKDETLKLNDSKVIQAFYQNDSLCLLFANEINCGSNLKWQPKNETIYDAFKVQEGLVVVTRGRTGQYYYIINNKFTHIIKHNFPKDMFHLTGVSKKLNHLYFSSETKKQQNIILFD